MKNHKIKIHKIFIDLFSYESWILWAWSAHIYEDS